ncbi:hypothetical protein A176_006900 [Myxococcus hansupus]|uniref:Uncharacterized protein n=1 Tax=Pseudomyxococcus hansupus TaxID=1297742 RepID=A0A0H4X7V7_9BACT|nr:hypothetical protein A176_006900 [Myxococcus hansupus]
MTDAHPEERGQPLEMTREHVSLRGGTARRFGREALSRFGNARSGLVGL